MKCHGRTDEELFRDYRDRGDRDAFALLFRRTRPVLLRLATRLRVDTSIVEDLVQTTFLVAVEKAQIFDVNRSLIHWLTGILLHEAQRVRRARHWKTESRGITAEVQCAPTHDGPGERFDAIELHRSVSAAISTLCPPYRAVVQCHVLRGMAANEIAERLSCSASTVRTQLFRGLALLRAKLARVSPVAGHARAPRLQETVESKRRRAQIAGEGPRSERVEAGARLSTPSQGRVDVRRDVPDPPSARRA